MMQITNPIQQFQTLDNILNQIGLGKFHLLHNLGCGLASSIEPVLLTVTIILGDTSQCYWHLTPWKASLLPISFLLGNIIGILVKGGLSFTLGRRHLLILCTVVAIYNIMILQFAPDFQWMIVLLGIIGFFAGGASVNALLLSIEVSPHRYRPYSCLFLFFFCILLNLIASALAYSVNFTISKAHFIPTVFAMFAFGVLSLGRLESSPIYLLMTGQGQKAFDVVRKIASINKMPNPLVGQWLFENKLKVGSDSNFMSYLPLLFRRRGNVLFVVCLFFIWFGAGLNFVVTTFYGMELHRYNASCLQNKIHFDWNLFTDLHVPSCCKTLTKSDIATYMIMISGELLGLCFNFLIFLHIGRKYAIFFAAIVAVVLHIIINLCSIQSMLSFLLFLLRATSFGLLTSTVIYTIEVLPSIVRSQILWIGFILSRFGFLCAALVAVKLIDFPRYQLCIVLATTLCGIIALISLFLPVTEITFESHHEILPHLGFLEDSDQQEAANPSYETFSILDEPNRPRKKALHRFREYFSD